LGFLGSKIGKNVGKKQYFERAGGVWEVYGRRMGGVWEAYRGTSARRLRRAEGLGPMELHERPWPLHDDGSRLEKACFANRATCKTVLASPTGRLAKKKTAARKDSLLCQ